MPTRLSVRLYVRTRIKPSGFIRSPNLQHAHLKDRAVRHVYLYLIVHPLAYKSRADGGLIRYISLERVRLV